MKTILLFLTLALASIVTAAPVAPDPTGATCAEEGHAYGHWFQQEQMYYIPAQPAHRCERCGTVQNFAGYWAVTKAQREADARFWGRIEAEAIRDIGGTR